MGKTAGDVVEDEVTNAMKNLHLDEGSDTM
jgi:hypothetical protein